MADFTDPPAFSNGDTNNPGGLITKLNQLRSVVQLMIGTIGPNRGKTAWYKSLQDAGLIDGNGDIIPPSGSVDLSVPPAPTGFSAGAAISHVFISTDPPTFTNGGGYLKTRVYGATYSGTGPLPTFASAVAIDEFTGEFEAIPENPATEWHLWVTWFSKADVESLPAGGTNGQTATTGQDVSSLLEALTGQITQSQLYTDLSTQIDLIGAGVENLIYNPDFLPTVGGWGPPGSILARIAAGVPANAPSDYVYMHNTRDLLNSGPLVPCTVGESIFASVWCASASPTIAQTGLALYFYDSGNHVITTATFAFNAAGVTSWEQAIGSLQVPASPAGVTKMRAVLWINQASSGGADTVYFSKPCLMRNAAAIAVESGVRSDETGALFAQYTVKVDVNGYVSGFGLASTPVNGTPFSAFAVRADQFYVASPTGPGISPIVPFIVQTTPTTINGVAVPVGVYMSAAYIENGTITNAKIGNAQIDDAKVANLSAAKLTAGSIAVGEYIQSSNYITGLSGWRIDGNGNAELSGVVVRGTVFASSGSFTGTVTATSGSFTGSIFAGAGTIAGNTITGSDIHSPGFAVGSTGWQLTSGGAVYATELHVKDSTGLRIFDTQATGTNPVLKIGSAILIDAAGNASFGGTLTASNIVDTAQIVSNAVTAVVTASNPGTISVPTGSPTVVATASVTTSGEPVVVFANGFISTSSGTSTSALGVYRDGVLLFTVSGNATTGVQLVWSGIDSPAAGAHTYTVEGSATAAGCNASARSLGLMQAKR